MFAQTKRDVLVEYPIDVVYNTFVSIFPVKYYDLDKQYPPTHSFTVVDTFNYTFTMHVSLVQKTPNTTVINFVADYPHALMDLTHGGRQAIETVLEELLNQLDKLPKTGSGEVDDSDIEVVNTDNYVNTSKNKTHKVAIIVGYILCFMSIAPALYALINYDPDDFVMAMLFIGSILCFSMEISLSIILQYYEDSQSILHGRIQLCFCGLIFIILGFLIHPGLAIAGILIPAIVIYYFSQRAKSSK